jgi:transcriptional regulator with XRE-family HTH domain
MYFEVVVIVKISRIRKSLGMTQAKLAQLCGTSQQAIAKIESASIDPRLSTLEKVAAALNCELKDLFFSKKEFVQEIQDVMNKYKINPKKTDLLALNELCASERAIPSFHPYWEKIEISKNQIVFKED